jgi:hypothetical protein
MYSVFSLGVNAALITIDEVGMDAIFSQTSFGNAPIDIRLGAAVEYVDANLLNMDSSTKFNSINGNHFGGINTVNFWFLDDLSWCGNINANYVGCGETPGNDFVVESVFANSGLNAELLSHELGHNLGLLHRNDGTDTELMDPFINGGTTLLSSEVDSIHLSPLVQWDLTASTFYIDIIPVLIVAVATTVPEPKTMILLILGLCAIGMRRSI